MLYRARLETHNADRLATFINVGLIAVVALTAGAGTKQTHLVV